MDKLLTSCLPEASIDYCTRLSNNYDFYLDFSFNRKTKFGHYKYEPKTKQHIISINKDLSKPLFLITYLHELAHLEVMLTYGRKIKPHGKEWKATFSMFLSPVLTGEIFEQDLLFALKRHGANPKASLAADPSLWKALFPEHSDQITLDEIKEGNLFTYKRRTFKKLKNRRTRVLCFEPASGHNYLIPKLARVEPQS